jgi:ABC-type nitrate/sulfonate/bicarbonate transport system ATPase subunit
MTMVVVSALAKAYTRGRAAPLVALQDVHLHVPRGGFVSIVGPSGCGKSTLLRIIAGLAEPTSGQILLDGVASRSATERLGRSGYMPQHDALLPWRGVLDNAAVGLEMSGVSRREARRRARELLPAFGLDGFADVYPAALSGGMRQRVALLRTMLAGRPLLLLDEPFGALDALTRAHVQEWLLGVWGRFGQSVLFVTHDVDEALYLSDEVAVMSPRPGTIALSARLDLPRPRPAYEDLVTTPPFSALKRKILRVLRSTGGIGRAPGEDIEREPRRDAR